MILQFNQRLRECPNKQRESRFVPQHFDNTSKLGRIWFRSWRRHNWMVCSVLQCGFEFETLTVNSRRYNLYRRTTSILQLLYLSNYPTPHTPTSQQWQPFIDFRCRHPLSLVCLLYQRKADTNCKPQRRTLFYCMPSYRDYRGPWTSSSTCLHTGSYVEKLVQYINAIPGVYCLQVKEGHKHSSLVRTIVKNGNYGTPVLECSTRSIVPAQNSQHDGWYTMVDRKTMSRISQYKYIKQIK